MNRKQKLELTWIGKEHRPKLEPRILIEESEKSYHASHRVTDHDIFDNRLIFGDNLLALKALEHELTGKIRCVFIDPPYNTGSAFKHYDDGLEHSIWLSLMRERLELLRRLLSDDGSIWITIDDNEVHYLKVLCDEVFGRSHFLGNVVWQSKDTPGNDSTGLAQTHNHVLTYRKTEAFRLNLLGRNEEQVANYKNPDNDPRGPWARQSMNSGRASGPRRLPSPQSSRQRGVSAEGQQLASAADEDQATTSGRSSVLGQRRRRRLAGGEEIFFGS